MAKANSLFVRLSIGGAAAAALFVAAASCGTALSPANRAEKRIGCKFDSNRVCQNAMLQPFSNGGWLNGSLFDSYYSENSPPTTEISRSIKLPSGALIDVNCSINLPQRKVVYASPSTDATLSSSDRQWLRSAGYCIDNQAGVAVSQPAARK